MITPINNEIDINSRNLEYYIEKGYNVKIGETHKINTEDILLTYRTIIIFICDVCGDKKIIKYGNYLKYNKNVVINYCKRCKCVEKYGVDNISKIDIIKKRISVSNSKPVVNKPGKYKYRVNRTNRYTVEKWLQISIDRHGDKYDYSRILDLSNLEDVVEIGCPTHGFFKQIAKVHKNGHGCTFCNESRGEKDVRLYLDKHNINYTREKTFIDCKYKDLLYFDFFLSDLNICIEFDGEHHYKMNEFFGGEEFFKSIQIRDSIKNNYCLEKDITLIRIKYDENIEDVLKSKL